MTRSSTAHGGSAVRVPLADDRSVSGAVSEPEGAPRALVALAHGAGGDMNQALLVAVADRLAASGCLVLRFNFPYVDAGRRAPDRSNVLDDTVRAAAAWLRAQGGDDAPLVLGGKSMGGRAALRVATHPAAGSATPIEVAGLLFLGYPLHPSGDEARLRTDDFPSIAVPSLFVEGTRDTLCRFDLLLTHLEAIPVPVSLHVIFGGDHSFRVRGRGRRPDADIHREIAETAAAWVGTTASRRVTET